MSKTSCGLAAALMLAFTPAALAQSAAPASVLRTPEISAYYPDRAQRMNVTGVVLINCAADGQGVLNDCKVLSETPEGWDFGEAALRAARAGALRTTRTGRDGRVTTSVQFDHPSADGRDRHATNQRLAGPPSVSRLAGPRESIVSFPIAFNRTGALTEDLTDIRPQRKAVLAKAGAPGFFLGAFTIGPNVREVWCFLASGGPPADWTCLWIAGRYPNGVTLSLAADSVEPYDPQPRDATLNDRKQFLGPVFEEKPVDLPETPVLDYRFKRWTATAAEVDLLANGRSIRTLTLRRAADGTAALDTAAGRFQLRPAPDAAQKAQVTPP